MQRARKSRRILLIYLGLAVATVAAYEQVRVNDFVFYDDDQYVTRNLHVQSGLTGESVAWAFSTTFFDNWHPLTWLSHMLDVELYGLNPAGHHLTNLLLHILNSLVLLALLRYMTGSLWRSSFVAALFALHPLHVEAVAWVSERKELVCTLFGLLSLWAYVGYVRRGGAGRYLLTAAFLALGLMAKPMLVTLPLVFLLLDYWPLQRTRFGRPDGSLAVMGPQRSIGHLLLEKFPLLALSAFSSVITLVVQSVGTWIPLELRAANALVSYVRYLGKTLWPSDLYVLYQHPYLPGGSPWEAWQIAGAGFLLLAISVWVILRATRRPYAIVGWFWYLGTLVPVIGLTAGVGRQAMADRYTYLPLIGLFILIAWGGADLMSRWSSRRLRMRQLVLGGAVGIIAACAVSSWFQVRVWRDSVSLFEHALASDPGNFTTHFNLGAVLAKQGEVDEAISHYRGALRINPRHAKAHSNLGNALRRQGELDEAIQHYHEALRIEPGLADAHSNLGAALRSQGQLEAAMVRYRKALRIDPDHAGAHTNLGNALDSQGRLEEAMRHYRRALRIQPDHVGAHNGLAVALRSQRRFDEAASHLRRALRIDPEHADAHNNLALTLGAQGELDEAVKLSREALRLDPGNAKLYYNLGFLLGSSGQLEEAMGQYRLALRIDPAYVKAHNNLGALLAAQGELERAAQHYREVLRVEPDFVEAHYNLGVVLGGAGQIEEAIGHYREALRVEPDYVEAHNNLAALLGSRGQLEQAVHHYREALRVDPAYADAHFNLAVVLGSQGQVDDAIFHYRQVLRVNSDYVDAHHNLGVVLATRGELDEAIGHYQHALRLNPDYALAKSNLDVALKLRDQLDRTPGTPRSERN